MDDLLQVFPGRARAVALHGLYLNRAFRPAGVAGRPFVYANFISSLDGRIALPDAATGSRKVPATIANDRDWRLFQELTACADVLVTSGRYMRHLGAGVAQSILPVSRQPEFADLLQWRASQGLSPQPAVVIVSASGDFSIPSALLAQRRVFVASGSGADRDKLAAFRAQGAHILTVGNGLRVSGEMLIARLVAQGFVNIELVAGSVLFHTLLADGMLDRLYLTQAYRIIGGRTFDTIMSGDVLHRVADFSLRALFHDIAGPFAQSFGIYDCA